MRVILSAMGRAFLRDGLIALLIFGAGIWSAPNLNQRYAIAAAASYAALAAGFRAIRVFVPQLSVAIESKLHLPMAYAEVVLTGISSVISAFIVGSIGFFEAPNTSEGKAAFIAAMMGLGTALSRLIQAWLTPGEPGPVGINTPPQPVAPASLPEPLEQDPTRLVR
jgi:hypothetical protein